MPPRRRTGTPRRPRVAGLTPTAHRAGTETEDRDPPRRAVALAAPAPARTRPEPTEPRDGPEDVAESEAGADTEVLEAEGRAGVPRRALVRRRAVPLLALALVLLTGLAGFFTVAAVGLRGTPSAANTALVDVGATAEAAGQLSDAVETVYSFDYARLDENERAARDVITPAFGTEFEQLFGQVRELAPTMQAVVTATVTQSAVQQIDGERAVVLVFVDQQATRAADATQLDSAGRLTVTGERVDGRWKIADVHAR